MYVFCSGVWVVILRHAHCSVANAVTYKEDHLWEAVLRTTNSPHFEFTTDTHTQARVWWGGRYGWGGGERFRTQLQLESVEEVKAVCGCCSLEFIQLAGKAYEVRKPCDKVSPPLHACLLKPRV